MLIQDADLEYDPREYPVLLRPILEGEADVVYGSRFLGAIAWHRVLYFWHRVGNLLLTLMSNVFTNMNLTDMETCYKAMTREVVDRLDIRSERFGIEPEITCKVARMRARIFEVPISYHGRTFEEGKKIGWQDGIKALGAIIYFWLIDDLYVEPYGKGHLHNITGTPQYVVWLTDLLRPHLGDRVLEVGAGIGNLAGRKLSMPNSNLPNPDRMDLSREELQSLWETWNGKSRELYLRFLRELKKGSSRTTDDDLRAANLAAYWTIRMQLFF